MPTKSKVVILFNAMFPEMKTKIKCACLTTVSKWLLHFNDYLTKFISKYKNV